MRSLTVSSFDGLEKWFSSPGHAIVGGIALLIVAFAVIVLVVNIPDIVRTMRIHFM